MCVLIFVGTLCVGFLAQPACSYGEFYMDGDPEVLSKIQKILDKKGLQNLRPLYACDYNSFTWEKSEVMKALNFAANVSVGGLLSYMIGAGVGLKAFGVTAGANNALSAVDSAAGLTFSGALLDNFLQSLGINVSEYFLDRDVDTLLSGIKSLKTDWGISDYFVFVPTVSKELSLTSTPIVPLGADVRIRFSHMSLYASSKPQIFLLKEPFINTDELLGAQIQEYDITGKVRPTTVPFVFASERFNGRWIGGEQGINYQKIRISPDDPLKGMGRIVGRIALNHINDTGWGGLREVRLSSPINQGIAYGDRNSDSVFALVLNRDTLTVQVIQDIRPVGRPISLGFHIRGFHDHRDFVTVIDGRRYQWKDMADQVLSQVSCKGAGIANTYYSHNNQYSVLSFTPTKPGRVDLQINTFHGPLIIPGVAVVGEQTPFAGVWRLQGNGSLIRIIYVPENDIYKGVLEADYLQYMEAGDIIWRDLKSGPHSLGNMLFGKEVRGDGRGGMEQSNISLQLSDSNTLIYKQGKETHVLIRINDQGLQ
jgi:hypothetical protein